MHFIFFVVFFVFENNFQPFIFSEKDRQLQSKHEETHNLQKKIDFLLSDLQMQKSIQEKTNEKIKHLEEEKEEIRKRWEERVKCLNGDLERSRGEGRVHQMDNDKMRMEISSLNGQLQVDCSFDFYYWFLFFYF